jgi:MFS family permease
MHDIGFTPRRVTWRSLPREASAVGATGLRHGWRSRPLRLVIVAGAVQNGLFFWAWYAWQPYLLELLDDGSVWVAGVVAALLALSMMAGNALVGRLTRTCRRRSTLLLWSGAAFGSSLALVGWAGGFWPALAGLVVASVAMGVQMPVRQALIHEIAPTEARATVVSFDSMIGGVGAVGGQAGLGVLADRESYSAGYVVGGLATLAALPFLLRFRALAPPADFLSGPDPAEPASCTPQGLPALSTVDGGQTLESA